MIAIDLITDEIPPLMHSDTGEKALNWMEEFKVSHLPVIKVEPLEYDEPDYVQFKGVIFTSEFD